MSKKALKKFSAFFVIYGHDARTDIVDLERKQVSSAPGLLSIIYRFAGGVGLGIPSASGF